MAAFRFTRKVGQDLGAFGQEVETRGWEAALEGRGLALPARGAVEMLAPGVAGVLAGNGGGLEEAVVRTALALVIREARQSRGRPEAAELVRQFLVTAVHLRLALDLGEKGVRVNAISAGPIRTLAASAISNMSEIFGIMESRSPMHRSVTQDEVGKSALYLLSDMSSGVTGDVHFVDTGYNIVGL